ncbi:MAG: putative porin [Steroidobacter sp.]
MYRRSTLLGALLAAQCVAMTGVAAAAAVDPAMEEIMRRLAALERQNQELTLQVEALQQQNGTLRGRQDAQRATLQEATPPMLTHEKSDDWTSRIRVKGDIRFRHENIDVEALPEDRTRETLRARFGAAIKLTDSMNGEIAFASGGNDPRGGSATLGAASSRKDIGLDLAYMSWRPFEGAVVTAGKMRQPFVRPGLSAFFDNEIRPEGVAIGYKSARGVFGSAFRFWLEERSVHADSMLSGVQAGWESTFAGMQIRAGAGYYDYGSVQGRFPGFGDGVVNQLGNTIIGAGADVRYAYDYNIGQLFAEASFPFGALPLSVFADYARNSEADSGLDTAWNLGVLVGNADQPGRWEAGVLAQHVEKDALFGQWVDSDFAGGVTDNSGQVYRVAWMAMKSLLVNVTYLDTAFNVDVGAETDYTRWQLDFNFMF